MPRRAVKSLHTNTLIAPLLVAASLGCGATASSEPRTSTSPTTEATTGTTRAGATGEASDEPGARRALIAANNRFSVELYRAIADAHQNQTASPHSIATAFGMVREGAEGETRAELDRALHVEGDVTPGQRALAAHLEAIGRSGVTLESANRVFLDDGLQVLDAFRVALRDGYRAPFEALAFAREPDAAREHINGWIAGQTHDRIRDLLARGTISSGTRLVLANAVYFHGAWSEPFDRARTAPLAFHVDGQTEVQVPTMRDTRSLQVARLDGVTVGQLPYAGGAVAMVVVIPDARDGLSGLLSSLDADQLARWTGALRARDDVRVALPRFRIAPTESVDLIPSLRALGALRVFDASQADLSGITGRPGLVVGAAVHRAFVEVNEEGTEAAAATAVVVMESAAFQPDPPPELIADHPFLFFIRELDSGLVLFLGHVVDPRASAAP